MGMTKKTPISSIRILPHRPSITNQSSTTHQHGFGNTSANEAEAPDFFASFGKLGPLLFATAVVSGCWTTWLIVLNVSPNDTANYLMGTAEFDEGNFWLIIDPPPALTTVNALTLGALVLGYVHVLLKMTFLRNRNLRVAPAGPRALEMQPRGSPLLSQTIRKLVSFWVELTGYNGHYRKLWNVLFKMGDLVVQSLQLHQLMEAGFSTLMCYIYASLLAMSSLSHTIFILSPVSHSAFTEVLVDTVFDMMFAIGYPILLVFYSYTVFELDRGLFGLYLELFSPGTFQRQVRMQADPISTTLFRFCFDSLRTLTWLSFLVRFTINLSFCYRLTRLVEVLYQRRRKMRTTSSVLQKLKAQRPVPRWVALLFLAASVIAIVHPYASITTSQQACVAYPQCVAFAYRQISGGMCPCLALVDTDRAPKSYEEWANPEDVTSTVRALAASGDLQVLQITNRQLKAWPDELQHCIHLHYISLYYTGLEAVPSWAKVFTELEFLDIQGKTGERCTVSMPPDVFSGMSSLAYIHLGYQPNLVALPSFEGLTSLKSVSLALLYSLESLPPIDSLTKLQRLELMGMNSLKELPDVSSNTNLKRMVLSHAPACCNGYIGLCDTTHPVCISMDEADCFREDDAAHQPSAASQAIFDAQPTVCDPAQAFIPYFLPTPKANVDMCDGVMYRQCHDSRFPANDTAGIGICYNDFFTVIACCPHRVSMRQQEILRDVGTKCDPDEEAWLGCGE